MSASRIKGALSLAWLALLGFVGVVYAWRTEWELDRFYAPETYRARMIKSAEFAQELASIAIEECRIDKIHLVMMRGVEARKSTLFGISQAAQDFKREEDAKVQDMLCDMHRKILDDATTRLATLKGSQ